MPACGSRQARQDPFSSLAEVGEHGVDELKGLVDLLTDLGTGQDDLAGDEDEEDDLGLHHTVDETGEEFGLVGAEHVVTASKAFKTDGELDVARSDDVLDLEVGELCVEAELLDDTGVLARGKLAVVLRLGTGDDHLARGEDQGGGLGLTDTHDDGSETLGDMLAEGRKPRRADAPVPWGCIPRYGRAGRWSSGQGGSQG
jgi:hypothetical protein